MEMRPFLFFAGGHLAPRGFNFGKAKISIASKAGQDLRYLKD
jgi:hypothetical protein